MQRRISRLPSVLHSLACLLINYQLKLARSRRTTRLGTMKLNRHRRSRRLKPLNALLRSSALNLKTPQMESLVSHPLPRKARQLKKAHPSLQMAKTLVACWRRLVRAFGIPEIQAVANLCSCTINSLNASSPASLSACRVTRII